MKTVQLTTSIARDLARDPVPHLDAARRTLQSMIIRARRAA
jgi:hypothetical protein